MDPVIARAGINRIRHLISIELVIVSAYRLPLARVAPINFTITVTPNTVIAITAIDRIKAVTTNQNVVMYVAFKAVIAKTDTTIQNIVVIF